MAAFNGTTVTFDGSGITPLVGVSYSGTCSEVDVGGAGDASQLVEAGLKDESVTVEAIGKSTILSGATGALVITWNVDGARFGFASAICTAVSDGGSYDGEITCSYTFRPYA
jgi:hypothetical protein